MTVLVAEGIHEAAIQLLSRADIRTATPFENYSPLEIRAIVVRSVFKIDGETLSAFPALQVVAKLGTGLDNIDLDLCARRRIEVWSTPGLNSVSTAEFIVMQILGLCKNTYLIYEAVHKRDFRRHLYYGRELQGMTAGIIGFGNVGKAVAERLSPFVREIVICEKKEFATVPHAKFHFVQDPFALVSRADILILAVSLKGNENMVDENFLAQLKPDVLIVNAARGGLIDEGALLHFLQKNPKVIYHCDILKEEPDYDKPPEEQGYRNPLLDLPNVFYTPHIASMAEECQKAISLEIARRLAGFFKASCVA